MSQFFPNVCQQAHCTTCRASVSGFKWRTEIAAIFRVPNDDVNWPCPHGFAWDETVPPPFPVSREVLTTVGETSMTLDQLRQEIEHLGSPEWLVMKLHEAMTIIGDERNCSSCVTTARCRELQKNVNDWKRLNILNSPLSTEAPV